jgi:CheY-like chemotaxis protein
VAKTVLVVDDDATVQKAISRILENAGFEVVTSPFLATSLSSALGGKYDLMTLDINMPGINGVDVAKIYKSKQIRTPIVIVSGMVDQVKEELIEAGIRHFVSKPFTAEGLLDAVRDAPGEGG